MKKIEAEVDITTQQLSCYFIIFSSYTYLYNTNYVYVFPVLRNMQHKNHLYLKKAGLASRNIVHLEKGKKIPSTLCRLLLLFSLICSMQHSFNLQQLVLKIYSNYFKSSATLLICNMSLVDHRSLPHRSCTTNILRN